MKILFKILNPIMPNWGLSEMGRLVFALTLFPYYIGSALTKFDGFGLSTGAYYQIFPKAMEAVNYDASALSFFHHVIVAMGSLGEFILPMLIIIGLVTRFSALGMMVFISVQSIVDIYGHGVAVESFRLIWGYLLLVLLVLGGGRISLDAVITKNFISD